MRRLLVDSGLNPVWIYVYVAEAAQRLGKSNHGTY